MIKRIVEAKGVDTEDQTKKGHKNLARYYQKTERGVEIKKGLGNEF